MDLYCKIFIDTDSEYKELYENIKNFVNGKKSGISFIECGWGSISINRNKEYITESDDFLYWKHYIDVESLISDEKTYMCKVRDLFRYLKNTYSGAVAACDFEELL